MSLHRERQDRRDQELYGGLIRLHILHHASKEPVFGLWFIEELAPYVSGQAFRAQGSGSRKREG
jgi:hypothetical protein